MEARPRPLWLCFAGRLKMSKLPAWRDAHATFRGMAILAMI